MTYGEIQKYYRDGKFEESRAFSDCFYVFFAAAVFLLIVVPFFILQTVPVLQQSMYPTIHGGEEHRALEDKVGLSLLSGFGRGDIVVFRRSDAGGTKWLVKRVLAVPGDKIRLAEYGGAQVVEIEADLGTGEGRAVYRLDEPYLNPANEYKTAHPGGQYTEMLRTGWFELFSNQYFVAGDNRESSLDSFSFGPVSGDVIEGKVVCIYSKCASLPFLDIYRAKGTGATVTHVATGA